MDKKLAELNARQPSDEAERVAIKIISDIIKAGLLDGVDTVIIQAHENEPPEPKNGKHAKPSDPPHTETTNQTRHP